MGVDNAPSTDAWWWAGEVQSSSEPDMRFKCVVEVDGEGGDGVVCVHLFRSGESWIGHATEPELESGRVTSSDGEGNEDLLTSAELSESSRVAKVRQSLSDLPDRERDDVEGENALNNFACDCLQVHVDSSGAARAVTFAHVFSAPDIDDSNSAVQGMAGLRVVFAVVMLQKSPSPCSFLTYLTRRMSIAKRRLAELKEQRAQIDREADALDRAVNIVKDAVDQGEESTYATFAEAFCDELNAYKRRLADNLPNGEAT